MRTFGRAILGLFISLFAVSAYASVETTCIENDCFINGWENYDHRTGETSTIMCRQSDCFLNGWSNVYKDRLALEVFCKAGGCFNEGWTVQDPRTGNVTADVTCQTSFAKSDCLEFGWTTYENGQSYITRCVNGDCRNIGWDVRIPGANPLPIRCKTGGCFTAGWITYN